MRKTILAAAWLALATVPAAEAVPVTALALVDADLKVVINDGIALDGVEIIDGLTQFQFDATSALDAPDAVNDSGSTNVIAGLDPTDPSEFTGFDRTTRNADSEGAQADYAQYNYGIRLPSTQPGVIANPLVEYRIWGFSLSTARIDTEAHDTSADSFIDTQRLYTFENYSNDPISFTIAADFELSVGALFEEAEGFARASGTVDLLFDSADPLDITFAALAPYLPDEFTDGDNATTTLSRFVDPDGVGMVGLGASASALGVDVTGSETATAMATDQVLLNVTLQPGQVMTMQTQFILTSAVEIQPLIPVPVPGALLLMLAGLAGLQVQQTRKMGRPAD